MSIERVLCMGSGPIGVQGAARLAQSGVEVRFMTYRTYLNYLEKEAAGEEISETDERTEAGLQTIQKLMENNWERGNITEEQYKDGCAKLIGYTDLNKAVQGIDLFIESIPENIEEKKALFIEMDKRCTPPIILASNTSSLWISEMAAVTSEPARVAGFHFANPAHTNKYHEVVKCLDTEAGVIEDLLQLAIRMGKDTAVVSDLPGFSLNRILISYLNEGAYILMDGVAEPEDIDKSAVLGMGFPIGPLALLDYVGIDLAYRVISVFHEAYGERFRPCPLIIQKYKAGHYGRKTGKGFYTYPKKDA